MFALQYVDDFAVVMVTLCDYMTRKFQRRMRTPSSSAAGAGATTSDDVTSNDVIRSGDVSSGESAYLVGIENALHSCRTKLKSSHARSRITHQVLSIDDLLPSSVRAND